LILLQRLTIRTQLSLTSMFIAFMVLIILVASYLQMSKIIHSNNEKYTKDIITQMKQTVNANKDVIDRLMMNIAFNLDVQNFLTEENTLQRFMYSKRIDSLLINLRALKEGILDIVIQGEDGRWFDLEGGNRLTESYRQAIAAEDSFRYFGLENFGDQYKLREVFLIGFKIKYFQSGELFNQAIGTLFFIIDPQALIGEYTQEAMEMNRQAFLVDRNKKIVSNGDQLPIGSTLDFLLDDELDGEQQEIKWNEVAYIANMEYLPEIDSLIVSMLPKSEIMRDMVVIQRFFAIFFIVCAVILAFLFSNIINRILRPLKKLMTFMSAFKRGNLNRLKERINLDGYVEISVMANELNNMLNEIESLTYKLVESNKVLYGIELEKKQAELSFLRSQINPHFLYNTLEMIKGMAAVKGVGEIREIAMSLGRIFRYSIKGEGNVPLVTELSIVESYLQIQRLRFVDRFSVSLNIEEETLHYTVPKMILQPIVENAVSHGLELKEKPGVLKIISYINSEDDLIVIIEDDGIGMEPGRLEEVRKQLNEQDGFIDEQGIGFANVNKRIQLVCGPGYGLAIDSTVDLGTRITVKLSTR